MTRRAKGRVLRYFAPSFNAAQQTFRGMFLSSRLPLIPYIYSPFLIFIGVMIKFFLMVINNVNCQMPVEVEMMSESKDFFFSPCEIIILVCRSDFSLYFSYTCNEIKI